MAGESPLPSWPMLFTLPLLPTGESPGARILLRPPGRWAGIRRLVDARP